MNIWFTSDQHFSHGNIIKFCDRPFRNVHEMNYEMIRRWNEKVDQYDIVYHLGDFGMCGRDAVMKILAQLHGQLILLPGNHDRGWHTMKDYGFDLVLPKGAHEIVLGNHRVTICHYPFREPDWKGTGIDRFAAVRPQDTGQWLIHGHVHEKWRFKGRMLNVGVDVWDFAPVHANCLLDYIDSHPDF